jgi:hypothetical protein
MSNKVWLTKTLLRAEQEAIKAGGEARRLLWDTGEVAGFGARVGPKGIMFVLNYRHGALERRMTLGRLGELTVDQARRRAAELRLAVRAGADPLQDIRDKRRAAERGITLATVVERWMDDSRSGWSSDTARLYRSILKKDVLPRLGERDVESISRREWANLLADVRSRAPATATLLRRIIGSVLAWAADAHLLTAVNLPSAKRIAPKVAPRARLITDDEIRRIWAASKALEPRQQAFARFVLLTATRSGAAALARREWIDGPAVRFPGSTHGVKRRAETRDQEHRVALSDWAWEQVMPATGNSPLLFSEGRAPIRPARVLVILRDFCGISDWEWHDTRRSFRSWCAKVGIPADAAETALGHVTNRDEVSKAYQKYRFEQEAERALHRWQAHIERLITDPPAAEIITLRAG